MSHEIESDSASDESTAGKCATEEPGPSYKNFTRCANFGISDIRTTLEPEGGGTSMATKKAAKKPAKTKKGGKSKKK